MTRARCAPLLDAFEVSLDPAAARPRDGAAGCSPRRSVAPTRSTLRRLRRALRAEERDGGGGRASDDLLVEAVAEVDRVATLPAAVALPGPSSRPRPLARSAADGRGRATAPRPRPCSGRSGTASRLAEPWRRTALAGGPAGARADRDLDAVVALFDAAARYVDRLPQAGPAEFLEHLRSQEVPGDTLVERAPADDAVALLTPQGAAGRAVAPRRRGRGAGRGLAGHPAARARCWARRRSSTCWPGAATARPRRCGPPRRRSARRSSGSFTSRSAARARPSS